MVCGLAALCMAACGSSSSNNCSDERFESLEVCVAAAIDANNNCNCVLDGDDWIQLPGND